MHFRIGRLSQLTLTVTLSAALASLVQGCSARVAEEAAESGVAAKAVAAATQKIAVGTKGVSDELMGETGGFFNSGSGLHPEPLKLPLSFAYDLPPPQQFSLPDKGKIRDIPVKCFSTKKDTVGCVVVGWIGAKTADTTYECVAKPFIENGLSVGLDALSGIKKRYELERCAKGEVETTNSEARKGEVKIALEMPTDHLDPARLLKGHAIVEGQIVSKTKSPWQPNGVLDLSPSQLRQLRQLLTAAPQGAKR